MKLDKDQIKYYQSRLNAILLVNMTVDGIYGPTTKKHVKCFQIRTNLAPDGIIGEKTMRKINQIYGEIVQPSNRPLMFDKNRFVVFVDAGHGSIDNNGNYVTNGKKMRHEGLQLHRSDMYYEGYENRLIAEAFIEECCKNGIMCIRTYDPYLDTHLKQRSAFVKDWLKRGYFGYLHSFHSNAISLDHSREKLEKTTGFSVWTTIKNNLSDVIATKHFDNTKEIFKDYDWRYLTQSYADKDPDFEANFHILRETDLDQFNFFGAILEEFGFHTSSVDCQFIINPKTRTNRVKAALKTALWTKNMLEKEFFSR